MRIIREKTAAVCVDYQERILPAMTDPETLLQNTVKLLKGLRVLGVPVYLTQQYTKGLGDTVAPIREAAGTSEHLEKLTFRSGVLALAPKRNSHGVPIFGLSSELMSQVPVYSIFKDHEEAPE